MRPKYDGIKFYSANDLSIGLNLEKSEIKLSTFDSNKNWEDINEVIELYNIQKLLNCGAYLKQWDEGTISRYKKAVEPFSAICARFFSSIDGNNFIDHYKNVCILYVQDFWALVSKYKVFNRIDKITFSTCLNETDITLGTILAQEHIVKYFDYELAWFMRNSDQTAPFLIRYFFAEGNLSHCYFPKELKPSEYENIFQRYVDSEYANPNLLHLIAKANSTAECPISDKLRLSAKRKYVSYWENNASEGVTIKYGVGVSFSDNNGTIIQFERQDSNNFQITYDSKWVFENLDYPTLMNNFIYLFEQFDHCWRSNLVSIKSQIGPLERCHCSIGKKDYQIGIIFQQKSMLFSAQIRGYYSILKQCGIRLEDVFKWFFDTYMLYEFGAGGFLFNPPSPETTILEKCRNLVSEMDGVLKQYRMFISDGEIDRELLEMSSEHIIFSSLGSFINQKYAYSKSTDMQNEQFLLFSDQSDLTYTDETGDKYPSFYELIKKETMKISDFFEYQITQIEWLIKRGSLIIDEDGSIRLNNARAFLIKDLYDNEVICLRYYNDSLYKEILEQLNTSGDLRYANTLFSEPEQSYLSYMLNRAQYSNGLDLRNKYSHSTYPNDESEQANDYIELLKVMVLIIGKINEEFCARFPIENTEVTS